jgi:hypothetical protein
VSKIIKKIIPLAMGIKLHFAQAYYVVSLPRFLCIGIIISLQYYYLALLDMALSGLQ